MRGFYTYKDFDEKLHAIYILKEEGYSIHCISSETYLWLKLYGFESRVDEVLTSTLMSSLPHLKEDDISDFTSYLPEFAYDIPLEEDDIPYTDIMRSRISFFYFFLPSVSTEEKFRILAKNTKELGLPDKQLSKIIQYLFQKHVTDENRFRLLLHCGIGRFLHSPVKINQGR